MNRKNVFKKPPEFILIHFDLVSKYEISLNEYCILSFIYYLKNDYKICHVNKKKFADNLGLTIPTIHSLLKKLNNRGFLIKISKSEYTIAHLYTSMFDYDTGLKCFFYIELMKDLEINNIIEYACLYLINLLHKNNNGCFMHKKKFAKYLGVSEREIYKILIKLEDSFYIERIDKRIFINPPPNIMIQNYILENM